MQPRRGVNFSAINHLRQQLYENIVNLNGKTINVVLFIFFMYDIILMCPNLSFILLHTSRNVAPHCIIRLCNLQNLQLLFSVYCIQHYKKKYISLYGI